uniref:Immunoglobulin V-set domain-containing protein n=1 Tax=Terrapene triunguis TaxID=2587831 RepID=A0A674JLN6_9SAUR
AAELPFAGVSLLLPGLTGPEAVSGLWGRSVSVPCQYHEGYQETPKYWCSGIIWQSCSKVVETTGSEAEVTWGRVSIRDNHILRVSKSDFNSLVSVTVLPGDPHVAQGEGGQGRGQSLLCLAPLFLGQQDNNGVGEGWI